MTTLLFINAAFAAIAAFLTFGAAHESFELNGKQYTVRIPGVIGLAALFLLLCVVNFVAAVYQYAL